MSENEQIQQSAGKNNTLIIGLLTIAFIAAVSFVLLKPGNKMQEDSAGNTVSPVVTQSQQMPTTAMMEKQTTGEYKNGTYKAVGEYTVPGAKENVGVSVTITDGIITAVEVEQLAKLPISKQKQADFAANYKEQVVGKNIDEVVLTKVSGSSLTPKGFNDALEQIKTEAKS